MEKLKNIYAFKDGSNWSLTDDVSDTLWEHTKDGILEFYEVHLKSIGKYEVDDSDMAYNRIKKSQT